MDKTHKTKHQHKTPTEILLENAEGLVRLLLLQYRTDQEQIASLMKRMEVLVNQQESILQQQQLTTQKMNQLLNQKEELDTAQKLIKIQQQQIENLQNEIKVLSKQPIKIEPPPENNLYEEVSTYHSESSDTHKPWVQCQGYKRDGNQCTNTASHQIGDYEYCGIHPIQCIHTIQDGSRCSRKADGYSNCCWQHKFLMNPQSTSRVQTIWSLKNINNLQEQWNNEKSNGRKQCPICLKRMHHGLLKHHYLHYCQGLNITEKITNLQEICTQRDLEGVVRCPDNSCNYSSRDWRIVRHCLNNHSNIYPKSYPEFVQWIKYNKEQGVKKLRCPFCNTQTSIKKMKSHIQSHC